MVAMGPGAARGEGPKSYVHEAVEAMGKVRRAP
jgi:hypothetical protein